MTKTKCKEAGCEEEVEYRRKVVSTHFEMRVNARDDNRSPPKRVYLTCPNGHTHVYTIRGDEIK
jgi:hypothetical protein